MANININIECATDLEKLKGITYGSLNVRRLFRLKDEIDLLLAKSDFDILPLSETFLNYSAINTVLAIDGYNVFRQDRDGGSGKRGGGGFRMYSKTKYKLTHLVNMNLHQTSK